MATSAPRSIVCAINFTPASDRALDAALYLARLTGARLALVQAVARASERPAAEGRLRALAEQRAPGTPVDLLVEVGEPAHTLGRVSRERQADLLVMGRNHASDTLVTVELEEAVPAMAPCPVLQVTASEDPQTAAHRVFPLPIPEIRCTVCGQPRGTTICDSCRLRIASEHLVHKLDQEHVAGRGLHLEDRRPMIGEPPPRRS